MRELDAVESDMARMLNEGKTAEWNAIERGLHEIDWLLENGYPAYAEWLRNEFSRGDA